MVDRWQSLSVQCRRIFHNRQTCLALDLPAGHLRGAKVPVEPVQELATVVEPVSVHAMGVAIAPDDASAPAEALLVPQPATPAAAPELELGEVPPLEPAIVVTDSPVLPEVAAGCTGESKTGQPS